jgi:stage V sporulation protein D (sporulation-specific penicillin-binding protein)
MVRIQIIDHETYAESAAQKHYRMIRELPIRGAIVDRNGTELAGSSITETIGMTPSAVKGSVSGVRLTRRELAQGIAEALGLVTDDVLSLFLTDAPSLTPSAAPSASPSPSPTLAPALEDRPAGTASYVLLKKRITTAESEALKTFMDANSVSGIRIDREVKRYYPDGTLAPQVVGFASEEGGGLLGLELQYDSELTGTPGLTYVETDNYYGSNGLPFSVPVSLRAQDGLTLNTTIDARIQRIAAAELQKAVDLYQVKDGGVVIVMDPYTGDVLAMVSCPGFDANDPTARPDSWTLESWKPTSADATKYLSSQVWRNRAISDTYEPGSTFKAITASIAFEEGLAAEKDLFDDAPITEFPEWPINCWRQFKLGGNHGTERLEQAFWNSCNPVFVEVSRLIGIDRFYRYVKAYGFETTTGIDLPGEGTGIFHAKPTTIDMYSLSFGEQSTVTPISLLSAYNAFANGGTLVRPRMVSSLADASGRIVREIQPDTLRRVISESTAVRVRAMMQGVVLYGTGFPGYVEGYSVAGKTSTSNTATEKVVSFAAMAPSEQPVLTILVVLNAPSSLTSSSASSIVAGKIISRSLETLGVERVYTDKDQSMLASTLPVPPFIGKTLREARKIAITAGFSLEAVPQDLADDAIVAGQFPAAGTRLHRGGGIAVSLSKEVPPGIAVMPDLTGKTVSEVISALYEAGLNVTFSGDLFGLATKQAAEPGTELPRWSQVDVGFTKETAE